MRAIGIILAGGNNHRMRELSNKRAIAAMPVAGSYRSIDFAQSNMSNSHVQKVVTIRTPLYYYQQRHTSALNTMTPKKINDFFL